LRVLALLGDGAANRAAAIVRPEGGPPTGDRA